MALNAISFLVINDLPDNIRSSVRLFAVDSGLFYPAGRPH